MDDILHRNHKIASRCSISWSEADPEQQPMPQFITTWKRRARDLKVEVYAVYLAYRDPRVPLYARIFAASVAGYAFSPIDLIPDFIPLLGYLDDLIIVPVGVALALKMIPPPVLAECRAKARDVMQRGKPVSRGAAMVIIAIWLLLAALAFFLLLRLAGK
jgi:uncharacterized membrane protein YkvA (DUF1232 family)